VAVFGGAGMQLLVTLFDRALAAIPSLGAGW